MCGQIAECEVVYTWIIHPSWRSRGAWKSEFGEELVAAAWKTRRLLGGLVSTSLDLPWVFLPVCGSGLARFWIGSRGTL